MVITNILCNRWIGHEGFLEGYKRYLAPLLVGAEACLFGSFYIGILAAIAFAVWRYDGWGEQSLAMHGLQQKYATRNQNKWVTKVADWIYTPNGTVKQRKLYGIIWGGLRGLYDLPAFIALGFLLGNPWMGFLGLLMGLQGVVYYLCAKYYKEGTELPELAMGALRGYLWLGALYGNFISAR